MRVETDPTRGHGGLRADHRQRQRGEPDAERLTPVFAHEAAAKAKARALCQDAKRQPDERGQQNGRLFCCRLFKAERLKHRENPRKRNYFPFGGGGGYNQVKADAGPFDVGENISVLMENWATLFTLRQEIRNNRPPSR